MKQSPDQQLLGDLVGAALKKLGITDERVTNFIGKPCGCAKRREYLNRLDLWARRVLSGRTDKGKRYFDQIVEDIEDEL